VFYRFFMCFLYKGYYVIEAVGKITLLQRKQNAARPEGKMMVVSLIQQTSVTVRICDRQIVVMVPVS
jgi:hypothetical protein